jgi:putative endonuclease
LSGERRYYVYIMASRSLNLYTGVTDNIFRRALEHKSGKIEGFTKKYHINRLVYYETFRYVGNAIAREKQVKAWTRSKRLALIKSLNPTWQDLADGWGQTIALQIPRFARDDKPEGRDDQGRPEKDIDTGREEQFPRFNLEKSDTENTSSHPLLTTKSNSKGLING